MAVKINPLDDRVVVTPLEAEAKTAGGVILPDSAQEKPAQGKVVAVGSTLQTIARNCNQSRFASIYLSNSVNSNYGKYDVLFTIAS